MLAEAGHWCSENVLGYECLRCGIIHRREKLSHELRALEGQANGFDPELAKKARAMLAVLRGFGRYERAGGEGKLNKDPGPKPISTHTDTRMCGHSDAC
jgi:hypothetical protein